MDDGSDEQFPKPSAALFFCAAFAVAMLMVLSRRRSERVTAAVDMAFDRLDAIAKITSDGHAEAASKFKQARAWWREMRPVVERAAR